MSFADQLHRLMDAARKGSRGIDSDKCLVYRDDLNELINQFLEAERFRRDRGSAT